MEDIINQKYYGTIEIDSREKDIIQIWHKTDVVQVERENLPKLIELLTKLLNPPTP